MTLANLFLLLALTPALAEPDPSGVRVYALPQGGELLVVPSDSSYGVVAGLVVPGGSTSRELPSYARFAWEYSEDAQVDLRFLQVAAPGQLDLSMAADHSLVLVSGEAIDERFVALVSASFNREPPYNTKWELGGERLDISGMVSTALTGSTDASAPESVSNSQLTEIVDRLSGHPDRVMFVAGDVTDAQALDLARRALPEVREAEDSAVLEATWPKDNVALSLPNIDSTWQVWAWPVADAATAPAARLLWHVLQRRVTRAVRGSRGWTYDVSVSEPVGQPGTACHLTISTPTSVATDAYEIVETVLTDLAKKPRSSSELDAARLQLLSDLATGTGPKALALEMAIDRVRTGAWRAPSERVDDLSEVWPADVQALAQAWLVDGPRAKLRIDPREEGGGE